jgi:colicin import membrane protein
VLPDADIATERARKQEAQRKALDAEKAEAERLKAKAESDAKLKKEAEARKAEENKRREDKAREDRAKLEEAQRKAAAESKAEDEQLAKQREENLRRMMGQAGTGPPGAAGTGGSGTAAQSSAPSASYVGRLIALIKPNIVFTGQVEGNPSAEVEVRSGAGGAILSRRLVKSSGNKDWDEAVLRAIDRTAALPRDADGRVPPALILVFRPGG